jgi:S-formylglutathione hydrolase FrmB
MLRTLSMTPSFMTTSLRKENVNLSNCRQGFRLDFALVIILFLSLAASAQSRTDCNAVNSRILKQSVHYCVQLPPDYDSNDAKQRRYPVLYFLHGLGQNEQTLFSTGGWSLIEDLRRQRKIDDFLVVAPDGGRSFYINSADDSFRYSDFFLQEFIPHIESRYRIRPGRQNRAITGISMGGYGALRFAFAHPELFSAVSAQSAALTTQAPQELNAAGESNRSLGRLLRPAFGQPIDATHWNRNSVFRLAKSGAIGLRKQSIYFNCGQQDDFGFEDGAATLHRQLDKEGVGHEYRPYTGDHSLTYFLSHMGEVMQFHSRVFAEHK